MTKKGNRKSSPLPQGGSSADIPTKIAPTVAPATKIESSSSNSNSTERGVFEWDVFISYSRADSDIAFRIRAALEKKGVKQIWIDAEQILPGDIFVKKRPTGSKGVTL